MEVEITTTITNDSTLIGKAISEIQWTKNTLVSNIERSGREIVPKGTTILEANDRLTVIMPKREVDEFLKDVYKRQILNSILDIIMIILILISVVAMAATCLLYTSI